MSRGSSTTSSTNTPPKSIQLNSCRDQGADIVNESLWQRPLCNSLNFFQANHTCTVVQSRRDAELSASLQLKIICLELSQRTSYTSNRLSPLILPTFVFCSEKIDSNFVALSLFALPMPEDLACLAPNDVPFEPAFQTYALPSKSSYITISQS